MNGKIIPDELVNQLLELTDWAPTHGRTEPWRYIVYSTEKMREFCKDHAQLYKENTPAEKFKEVSYNNLIQGSAGASHLIIAYMKRGGNPNIPEIEEVSAASASIQNLLLGAAAHGIAGFWSTSGMVHNDKFKDYFGLEQQDRVLGMLFLGYSDEPLKEGKRSVPLSEKIKWM